MHNPNIAFSSSTPSQNECIHNINQKLNKRITFPNSDKTQLIMLCPLAMLQNMYQNNSKLQTLSIIHKNEPKQ